MGLKTTHLKNVIENVTAVDGLIFNENVGRDKTPVNFAPPEIAECY